MSYIDRYVKTTAVPGGDGSEQHPWTLAEAAAQAAAGDRVNIEAGTYVLPGVFSPAASGEPHQPIVWRAYDQVAGDAVQPAVTLDIAEADSVVCRIATSWHRFECFSFTGNRPWNRHGCEVSGSGVFLWRCRATGTGAAGFWMNGVGGGCMGCEADDFGNASALYGGFQLNRAAGNAVLLGCHAHHGQGAGFRISGAGAAGGLVYLIAAHNGSAQGHGIVLGASDYRTVLVQHVVSCGNAGDGLRLESAAFNAPVVLGNAVLSGNGGYGISAHPGARGHVASLGLAMQGNAAGATDVNVTLDDIASQVELTDQPFVDADGQDFRLSAEAGGLAGAGFPGSFLIAGQLSAWCGHPDIGCVQQAVRPVLHPAFLGGGL